MTCTPTFCLIIVLLMHFFILYFYFQLKRYKLKVKFSLSVHNTTSYFLSSLLYCSFFFQISFFSNNCFTCQLIFYFSFYLVHFNVRFFLNCNSVGFQFPGFQFIVGRPAFSDGALMPGLPAHLQQQLCESLSLSTQIGGYVS